MVSEFKLIERFEFAVCGENVCVSGIRTSRESSIIMCECKQWTGRGMTMEYRENRNQVRMRNQWKNRV